MRLGFLAALAATCVACVAAGPSQEDLLSYIAMAEVRSVTRVEECERGLLWHCCYRPVRMISVSLVRISAIFNESRMLRARAYPTHTHTGGGLVETANFCLHVSAGHVHARGCPPPAPTVARSGRTLVARACMVYTCVC